MVVGPEHRDGRAGLGEPVRVGEADAGEGRQCALQDRWWHPRAAVGERAQGGRVRGRPGQVVNDPGQHGRHHHRAGDAVGAHEVQPGGGREARQVDDPAPGVEIGQDRPEAGDVVGRRGHERGLVLAGRCELDCLQHVGGQVLVPQQHALGTRRRAAGEQHDRGVVVGHVRRLGGRRAAGEFEELLAGVCGQPGVGENRQVGIVGDDDGLVELTHQLADLARGEPVVQRDQRRARRARREREDRQRRAVLAHKDRVPRARRREHRPAAGRGRGQLLIGHAVRPAADRQPVRVGRQRHVQHHRDRHSIRLRPGNSPLAWRRQA